MVNLSSKPHPFLERFLNFWVFPHWCWLDTSIRSKSFVNEILGSLGISSRNTTFRTYYFESFAIKQYKRFKNVIWHVGLQTLPIQWVIWRLRSCNTWSLLGSYPPKSTGCGIGQPVSSHQRDHVIFCLQTPYEAEKMAKSSGFTCSNLFYFFHFHPSINIGEDSHFD